MASPHIKRFRTGGKYYIYDVNTNHILETDRAIFYMAGEITSDDFSDDVCLRMRLGAKGYTSSQIDTLQRMRHDFGLLRVSRPQVIRSPYTRALIDKSLSSRLSHLILGVTEVCNLRCGYCVYSDLYPTTRCHSQRTMSSEIARACIDQFMARSPRSCSVGFYGGEPLTHFSLIQEVVEYVKTTYPGKEVRYNLTTNGLLLKGTIARYLFNNRFWIQISLDGPRDMHDRHRRTIDDKGTYDLIMHNIEHIRTEYAESFSRVRFTAILTPPNDVLALYKFFKQSIFEGAGGASFSLLSTLDQSAVESFRCDEDRLAKGTGVLKGVFHRRLVAGQLQCRGAADDMLLSAFATPLAFIKNRAMTPITRVCQVPGTCIPAVRKYFVDCSGDYYLCEKIDYTQKIGNWRTGLDRKEVHRVVQAYTDLIREDCRHCWAQRLCMLCYAKALTKNGFDAAVKRENCRFVRAEMLNNLKLFVTLMEENPRALDHPRFQLV